MRESFFQVEAVRARVDAIHSATGEIMYLVKGEKKALLIDTCLGVKGLRDVVAARTDLPVTVVLTHGHVDHAMGAPEFDTVYMNRADDAVQQAHRPLENRIGYIEANLRPASGPWTAEDFDAPEAPDRYLPLTDGLCFDLGGITAEAHVLAGHTPGTTTILLPEERVLITGDAANNALFLFDEFSSTVEAYRRHALQLLEQVGGRYDECWMMHHDRVASGRLLEHMVAVCDDILLGKTDDVPFPFMGGVYYLAKAVGPRMQRLDGGEGNIIYNKDKVREAAV